MILMEVVMTFKRCNPECTRGAPCPLTADPSPTLTGHLGGFYHAPFSLQTVGIQGPAPHDEHIDGSSSLDSAKALSIP